MHHRALFYATAAAAALLAAAAPARADRVDLMSSDGPMRIEIARNGEVDGAYPKLDGTLHGRISASGDIEGIWTQPRSDHPCREQRGGTYAWGAFEIAGIYSRHPMGSWGYCGERADRDWEIRRDR